MKNIKVKTAITNRVGTTVVAPTRRRLPIVAGSDVNVILLKSSSFLDDKSEKNPE